MSEQKAVYNKPSCFDLKVSSASELKQMFKAIESLVDEATFVIENEGLSFRSMDPSHVALIDVRMFSNSFEKFEVKEAGLLSVRIEELNKILHRIKQKDSLSLSANDNLLTISTKQSKTQLRVIESSSVDTPLPKISFNANIGICFNDFYEALKSIRVVSEYVIFEAVGQKFIISGRGDSGSNEITFEKGMPELPEFDIREDSKATYSLEYLLEFLKASALKNRTIELFYSTKMPLKLRVKLDPYSTIEFYLAPRVEDTEEPKAQEDKNEAVENTA